MFAPEFLYQLSARDQQITWLDPILRRIEGAAAAVTVEQEYTVPDSQVLILQNAVALGIPGAAQTVNDMTVTLRAVGAALAQAVYVVTNNGPIPADANTVGRQAQWSGSIIVPASWRVTAVGNFSAGAAANTVLLFICGILIPAGNIQRI